MEIGINKQFNKMCRSCLGEKDNMQPLFSGGSGENETFAKQPVQLATMLMACASVSVEEGDKLPTLLCNSCEEQLKAAYGFKRQCEKADEKLREYLEKNMEIKEEPNGGDSNKSSHSINDAEHEISKLKSFENVVCEICHKIYLSKLSLRRHQKVHEKEGLHLYDCCKQHIDSKRGLKMHLKKHVNFELLSCSICNKQYSNRSALDKHVFFHMENIRSQMDLDHDSDTPLINFVGSSLANNKSTILHNDDSNSQWVEKLEPKIEIIEDPDFSNMDENFAITQEGSKDKFSEDSSNDNTEDSFQEFETADTNSKQYKCKHCNKTFKNVHTLRKHECTHSGEKLVFKCKTCDKEFPYRHKLERHEIWHSGNKTVICDQCGKSFYTTSGLNAHKFVHVTEKPHVCAACGKSFTRESALKKHAYRHTGLKPYECTKCGKTFGNNGALTRHELLHTGLKPHKCSFCDKSFYESSDLKKHERVHTGEKPYSCKYCNKSFPQSSYVNKHIRIVHNKSNR